MEENKQEAIDKSKKSSNSFNKIYIISLALNLFLVLASAFLILYIKHFKKSSFISDDQLKEKIVKEIKGYPDFIEYKLEPFTVNLKKSKLDNYLNARFTLIAIDHDTKGELDRKVDLIRDKIIEILNNKSALDLVSVQGKLFLKDQIVTQINTILNKGSVKEVYIESFVIQ